MYILEWMGINDSGKMVSTDFYGGRNKKYSDLINITIDEYAKRFQSHAEATEIATRLNKVGYNFVVREI